MKNKKKISAILAALCLVLSVGCSEKKSSNKNSIVYYNDSNSYSQAAEGVENSNGEYTPNDEVIENIPTTPVKINEPNELFGATIKLTDVYNAGILKGNEFVRDDRQLLAFVCEVTNNTDSDININSFCLCIRYLDGEPTHITTGMREMIKAKDSISDMDSLNNTIKPGETVKGYSAISVSPEWESLTLYYNPDYNEKNDSLTFEITKDMVKDPS